MLDAHKLWPKNQEQMLPVKLSWIIWRRKLHLLWKKCRVKRAKSCGRRSKMKRFGSEQIVAFHWSKTSPPQTRRGWVADSKVMISCRATPKIQHEIHEPTEDDTATWNKNAKTQIDTVTSLECSRSTGSCWIDWVWRVADDDYKTIERKSKSK